MIDMNKIIKVLPVLNKHKAQLLTIDFKTLKLEFDETAQVVMKNYQSILEIIEVVRKHHGPIIQAVKVLYPLITDITEILKEDQNKD